ncbi:hypothetical protein HanXRQr2_Chr03g0113151 [Helianthus annuus]|uniref:Uncharacterized protein n=1 Tax=Helianthus annuus TaxID=4232 RepID=A0A9K3JGQ2_HELAN|nr:hypothetical protein HanXRQr2_Chr03g0113151 [Helianthus annuus]KAJ0943856.1 hypothetical protein HanPSC8_Chr03g0109531 [Helianthus annuus]
MTCKKHLHCVNNEGCSWFGLKPSKPLIGLVLGSVIYLFFGWLVLKSSNRGDRFGLWFISETGRIKPNQTIRCTIRCLNILFHI